MGHTMKKPPNKYDDIIDSRDVIERIAELESQVGLSATAILKPTPRSSRMTAA